VELRYTKTKGMKWYVEKEFELVGPRFHEIQKSALGPRSRIRSLSSIWLGAEANAKSDSFLGC